MRKDMAKTVMAAAGIKVAPGKVVGRFEAGREHVLEPPYVLKPVAEGSSCGVLIVAEPGARIRRRNCLPTTGPMVTGCWRRNSSAAVN